MTDTTPDLDELDDAEYIVVDGDVRRIDTFEADERGRINLGNDYADETVRVAVIDSEGDDGDCQ
jgi:hypothetical protein